MNQLQIIKLIQQSYVQFESSALGSRASHLFCIVLTHFQQQSIFFTANKHLIAGDDCKIALCLLKGRKTNLAFVDIIDYFPSNIRRPVGR